jgi:hypothetical protein
MSKHDTITINLRDYRQHEGQLTWDLPSWGHPISKLIMPLFILSKEHYIPVGTAFWVGPNTQFIITATHNIYEAMKHEPRLERMLIANSLPQAIQLREIGLSVLHHHVASDGQVAFSFLPLETLDAAPPTDVIFGYPTFGHGREILSLPLSFDPPRINETVWCVGYTDFHPVDGVPVSQLMDGTYDWHSYRHRFVVVEGKVKRIFTSRFDAGYHRGPCFSINNSIFHGQSGGPVISERGTIVGINSCDASNFFSEPSTLSAMLYPLLLTEIRFGAKFGAPNFTFSFKSTRHLVDMVMDGTISSDGSAQHVNITPGPEGGWLIGPRTPIEDAASVFDDYAGYQSGRTSTQITGEYYRFRPNGIEKDTPE